MRTAREWGVPPRVILRGGLPEWTFTDRVLAVASVLSDDLRCSGCGQPRHEAWNPDSEGWYEAKDAECQACAELERQREGESDHRFEVKRWIVDTRPPDEPLRPWNPLELGDGVEYHDRHHD